MGWTIKTSFFKAAEDYQPQLGYFDADPIDGQVTARVKGYTYAGNYDDYATVGYQTPRWVDDPTKFSSWDNVIAVWGKWVP